MGGPAGGQAGGPTGGPTGGPAEQSKEVRGAGEVERPGEAKNKEEEKEEISSAFMQELMRLLMWCVG